MKIINDREPTEVTFGSLESGEVFEWADGFYIKTTSEEEAVRLDDGLVDSFAADFKVYPVKAVLTIS